ncbi:MAG: GNAT family N-acetyltransferase [Luteibaculaceae bacterium]
MDYSITLKSFTRLDTHELYSIYKLRAEVFVVEQTCPYQDPDEADLEAFHLMLKRENKLIGYLRILPDGYIYPDYTVIGRVCLEKPYRNKGLAEVLMQRGVSFAFKMYEKPIKISAQSYLINFYNKLGFELASNPYLEDNIEHVIMIKQNH